MDTERLVAALATPPAVEPVTVADAKGHLRITHDDENGYIEGLIEAARAHVEEMTGRALITQSWVLTLDEFPADGVVKLPRPPVQSVTAVRYVDSDGATQVVPAADYALHAAEDPATVSLAYSKPWPTARDQRGAVEVEYVAGYGNTGADVPPNLLHAIKLLVAQMYAFREPEISGTIVSKVGHTVDALIGPYRVWWI